MTSASWRLRSEAFEATIEYTTLSDPSLRAG